MPPDTHARENLGSVETRADGKQVIRFERSLAHPVERVWAALTEPDELIRWWGEAEVDLVEGGRFLVRWLNTDDEGNRAVLDATITKLEPERLLETNGSWDGNDVELLWELRSEADRTVLTFVNTLELPKDFRTRTIAGWHWHLDALAEILEGGSADLVDNTGWERIHEQYIERLS